MPGLPRGLGDPRLLRADSCARCRWLCRAGALFRLAAASGDAAAGLRLGGAGLPVRVGSPQRSAGPPVRVGLPVRAGREGPSFSLLASLRGLKTTAPPSRRSSDGARGRRGAYIVSGPSLRFGVEDCGLFLPVLPWRGSRAARDAFRFRFPRFGGGEGCGLSSGAALVGLGGAERGVCGYDVSKGLGVGALFAGRTMERPRCTRCTRCAYRGCFAELLRGRPTDRGLAASAGGVGFFRELHRLRGTYVCPFPDPEGFAVISRQLCMVLHSGIMHNCPEVDATPQKRSS